MQTNTITGTSLSYADALAKSVKRQLFSNSRGEILYFIEEQNDGNLVYSSAWGFHLFDADGWIIFHAKGDNILWKSKLNKIRLYKKFLVFLSWGDMELSNQEKNLLEEYKSQILDFSQQQWEVSAKDARLHHLRLRFSLNTQIQILEKEFHQYRWQILRLVPSSHSS